MNDSAKSPDRRRACQWQSMAGPLLVHFRTPWCGQCQLLAASLEALSGELEGRLDIREVNLDQHPELSEQFGLHRVPTLILFDQGTPIGRFDGMPAREELRVRLRGLLADYSTTPGP